jgi:hypothetical protein
MRAPQLRLSPSTVPVRTRLAPSIRSVRAEAAANKPDGTLSGHASNRISRSMPARTRSRETSYSLEFTSLSCNRCEDSHSQVKNMPTSPGIPLGKSTICTFSLYPRGRKCLCHSR